jgi:hypothetical protein
MIVKNKSQLAGPYLKVERAKHQFKELQIEIGNFNQGDHHKIIFNQDIKGGEVKGILTIKDFPPFEKWAVIMGDIAHNLRSSLDLLACLLVRQHTHSANCRNVAFPISENVKSFNNKSIHRITDASPDAKAAIQELMPYHGGNNLFYYISQLNNYDKHRLLIPTFTYVKRGEFLYRSYDVTPPGAKPIIDININKPLIYENGAVFFRIIPRNFSIDPEMNVNGESALEVIFREPKIVCGKPVLPLFSDAISLVEDVLDTFKPIVTR